MCLGKHFETKWFFSKKNILPTLFADSEWRSSWRWQKFSTRVSKPEFSWPEEHFEKRFSGRGYNFISIQGFCLEILTCKKTPGSSNRHSACPTKHFEEKIFAKIETFRPLGNEQEKDGFLAKQFWQCCQLRIPCVQRNTLGQNIFFRKKT